MTERDPAPGRHISHVIMQNGERIEVLTVQALQRIQNSVIALLQKRGFQEIFDATQTFSREGFRRTPIHSLYLQEIQSYFALSAKALMIEVVEITGANPEENGSAHVHMVANALTAVLGEEHGLPDAKDAQYLLENSWVIAHPDHAVEGIESSKKWKEAHSGDVIEIGAGQAHDFRAGKDGHLAFLTVTSPEVGRDEERPDWMSVLVPR